MVGGFFNRVVLLELNCNSEYCFSQTVKFYLYSRSIGVDHLGVLAWFNSFKAFPNIVTSMRQIFT